MTSKFKTILSYKFYPLVGFCLCDYNGTTKRGEHNHRKNTSQTQTCAVDKLDQQHTPQQALYWEVLGYKRGPGRPKENWKGTIEKDLQKMGLTTKKQKQQLSAENTALNCGRNHTLECRVKSRLEVQMATFSWVTFRAYVAYHHLYHKRRS